MDKNTKMFYCSVDQKIWKITRTLDKVGNVHKKSRPRISIIALFSGCITHAMVYDNRFFPEFQRNPVMVNRELSAVSADYFIPVATKHGIQTTKK